MVNSNSNFNFNYQDKIKKQKKQEKLERLGSKISAELQLNETGLLLMGKICVFNLLN